MRFNCSKKDQVHLYRKELQRRKEQFQKAILEQQYKNLIIYTPVRTGFLRDSYQINFDLKNVTNDAGYVYYVNNGTSRQAGQHFIQISHRITLNKLNQLMKKISKK